MCHYNWDVVTHFSLRLNFKVKWLVALFTVLVSNFFYPLFPLFVYFKHVLAFLLFVFLLSFSFNNLKYPWLNKLEPSPTLGQLALSVANLPVCWWAPAPELAQCQPELGYHWWNAGAPPSSDYQDSLDSREVSGGIGWGREEVPWPTLGMPFTCLLPSPPEPSLGQDWAVQHHLGGPAE